MVLNRKEAAQALGFSLRTLDRLRESGLLPWVDASGGRGSRPAVRFFQKDLDEFLLQNRKDIRSKVRS